VLNLTSDRETIFKRSVWRRKNPENGSELNSYNDTKDEKLKKIEGYEEMENKTLLN